MKIRHDKERETTHMKREQKNLREEKKAEE
jgi:hypothetical protein